MRVLRRLLIVLALAVCVTTSAGADVVLHPGYVKGTSGLTNWTFSSGSVYLSSPSGFSGSTTVPGTAGAPYQVAVEGGQTYTSLGQGFSTNNGSFSSSRAVNLAVGVGATIANQDLLTPGGTIEIDISAATDPGASAIVQNFYFYATATNDAGTDSYSSYGYYGPTPVLLPMGASSSVSVNGYYVSFRLTDTAGNVCYVSQSLPSSTVATLSLAEGETAVVNQSFDLSGKLCPPPGSGTIRGTVTLNNVPSGLTPSPAQVYASGTTSQSTDITAAFAPASAPIPYVYADIPAGFYSVGAYAYFGATGAVQSYVSLAPNGNANYVSLNNGDDVTRDYTYDLGKVQGTFSITGPIVTALTKAATSSYAYAASGLSPSPNDSSSPNYGSSSAVYVEGYSGKALPPLPASYVLALPAGQWASQYYYALAYTNTDAIYLSVSDNNAASSAFGVTGGATVAHDVTIDTSQGDLVFDVAQPGINLSYPSVNISTYDPTAGRSVYISAQSYALNKDTATVRVIGPPGQYPFTASAYVGADCSGSAVGCSYATFPAGSITLGQASNTAVGTNEQVTLLDASGNPLGVQLTFDNVTTAGQTNGAYTTQGPVPPGGFTLMPAFNGATYLSLSTTATFTGNVLIAISYNPAALGLTPQTESLLQLWHYKCDSSGSSCQWEFINGGHSPDPDTANHVIYGVTSSFSVFALLMPPSVSSTPPSLTLTVSPNKLWPPNHKMVPITVTTQVSDAVDPQPQVTCAATSNEAASAAGSGNTDPDITWTNGKLSLRAERSGSAGDRIYTITCTARNVAGLTTTQSATVTVPHDQR